MKSITEIYSELQEFYRAISPEMGIHAHGARILYAPPKLKARVMFVGIQPGGTALSVDTTWPTSNEYADGARNLGERLRQMVDREVLREHTVGMNANFFRSLGVEEYKLIPLSLRKRIAAFCFPRAVRLITVLQPRTVFCIGVKAFDELRPVNRKDEMMRSKGKGALIQTGEIAGFPAVAVPHLTGSRINSNDLAHITLRLKSLLE